MEKKKNEIANIEEKELDITKLSKQEIKKYEQLTSGIEVGNEDSVLSYGSSISEASEAASEEVLKNATANNSGEVGNSLKALTKTMNDVELRDKSQLPLGKRLVASIPIIGTKLVSTIDNFVLNYQNISDMIDRAKEKFKQDLLKYEEANNRFTDDLERSKVYYQQYTELIRAAEYKHQTLVKSIGEDYKAGKIDNITYTQYINWTDTLKRQIHTLRGKQVKLKESMLLTLMQKNDNIKMYQMTKDLIANSISDWKKQAAQAVEARKMRLQYEALESAFETSDKMLLATTDEITETSKKIAKLRQREINSVEVLKKVKEKIFQTKREVDKMESERNSIITKADRDLKTLNSETDKELLSMGQAKLLQASKRQEEFYGEGSEKPVIADEFKSLELPEDKDDDVQTE